MNFRRRPTFLPDGLARWFGPMIWKVFVFGTLKMGFPLHDRGLSGAAFLGNRRTRERFPMLIAGPRFAPMMFNEPGVGFQVAGELYAVDDRALLRLDGIESIGSPGNWRVPIEVDPLEGGPSTVAQVYMKSRHLADPIHSGYLARYNDRRFVLPDGHPQIAR